MALVTLQTIFQDAFPAYEQRHALPAHVRRAAHALMQCPRCWRVERCGAESRRRARQWPESAVPCSAAAGSIRGIMPDALLPRRG
jgi:hypothetical protein